VVFWESHLAEGIALPTVVNLTVGELVAPLETTRTPLGALATTARSLCGVTSGGTSASSNAISMCDGSKEIENSVLFLAQTLY